jgi:excisionase family DNA binding protein
MTDAAATAAGPLRLPAYASVAEAATYTRLGERTLRRAIKAGTLIPRRTGARVLLRYDELDRFLRESPATRPASRPGGPAPTD